MHDRQASEAVRHDDGVLAAFRYLSLDCRYPIVAYDLIPIFDNEAPPVWMRRLPHALPVQWTGIAYAGNNENGVIHLPALHH